MAKKYIGHRIDDFNCEIFIEQDGKRTKLHHVKHHSPTGFNWGYAGSGAAETALSILCDFHDEKPTGKELFRGECKSYPMHQAFKRKFVVYWKDDWELDGKAVEDWVASYPDKND